MLGEDAEIPRWIKIENIEKPQETLSWESDLDAGEIEAIQLAQAKKADLLLTDDQKARDVAANLGLKVKGSIGVLMTAKEQKIIAEVKMYLDKMISQAGFWVSPNLYDSVLKGLNEL
ncbi:MAG: DUF3368 domain-containing protein [Microscillaceae bacterium]|nr:DUF3368 domain-containing protein [Microscillaceae bacterium]